MLAPCISYDCNHMRKFIVADKEARATSPELFPPMLANVAPAVRRLAAGEVLFHKGDPTFGIFRLVAGRIRLVRATTEGSEVPMHTVRPGELFAEASLFSTHYQCDAIALVKSEVLLYSKVDVVRQLKTNEEKMWDFAAEMASRLQSLRTQMEIRQIRSATQRVLQSLQLRCKAAGCWSPEGTLKQYAEEIGLTHEALYRALARLEEEGRIRRGKSEICLVAGDRHPHLTDT